MKCVLPAVNVKLFAKAIHCIAKIGSEIYFEPLESGLALKTVNSSRSAYICFVFMKPMFQTYEPQQSHNITVDDDDLFKCKVAIKTMLQVFKSLSTIERSVESCEINFNDEECRLVFELRCKHGITKTHQLTYQECESLQAVFAKDLSPNVLKCDHKLLSDVVVNFSSSLEELTMAVTPCQILLKSFVDNEFDDDPANIMTTEMALNPEEFTECQIGVDTEITFCLKDLRAILAFSDVANMPVEMSFEIGGKPLIFSVEDEGFMRANFVLATISNNKNSQHINNNATANVSAKSLNHSKFHNRPTAIKKQATKRPKQQNTSIYNHKQSRATKPQTNNSIKPKPVQKNDVEISPEIPDQNVPNQYTEDINDNFVFTETNTNGTTLENEEGLSPEIPVHSMQESAKKYKSVKTVFFRDLQDLTQLECEPLVLAPDSDEESDET